MNEKKCPECGGAKGRYIHNRQIGSEFKGGDLWEICPACQGKVPDLSLNDEEIGDWLYASLKEIEVEEGIRLSDKAFIADHLIPKVKAKLQPLIDEARKEGRKEVVNWIAENRIVSRYWNWEDDEEWQATLKKWEGR